MIKGKEPTKNSREEYDNFEALARKLVRVAKKEILEREKSEKVNEQKKGKPKT